MGLYPMFVMMAVMTILSPGPGVLKSLTNALSYGMKPAFIGIAGLACGVFCVACLSATALGAVLARSASVFNLIRLCGAAYLAYTGVKLWRIRPAIAGNAIPTVRNRRTLFIEGLILQFSNPGALFFFLAILPQFIRPAHAYLPQFLLLVLTFCGLLVVIHAGYAIFARRVQRCLGSSGGGRWLNRIGGTMFIGFALILLHAGGHT